MIDSVVGAVRDLVELGGIVMGLHIAMSVVAGAVILFKLWHHASLGVGRHRALDRALTFWDRGDAAAATRDLDGAPSYLAPILKAGMTAAATEADRSALGTRMEAEAGAAIARVEGGYRLLDMIAQIAPLLGLLGTVQGMIIAFQAMQTAGAAVSPSELAAGIWVALITTVSGLSVAIPVTMILGWLESRAARERVMADRGIQAVVQPGLWVGIGASIGAGSVKDVQDAA